MSRKLSFWRTSVAVLLLGGLALLLAAGTHMTLLAEAGAGSAALRQIMAGGEAGTPGQAPQNAYLAGLVAYAAGDFAQANTHLTAALPTHGQYARHWLALSLEQDGQPAAGRQVLDLDNDAELSLFGDILLRQWTAVTTAEKQAYLDLLRQRRPDLILPFANRLIVAQHLADAKTWARAAPDSAASPDALVTLGNAYWAENRQDEARPLFERAYSLRPDAITAFWYGTALAEGGDPAQGATLLQEAVNAALPDDPLLPWLLRELAVGYARSGRCAEAEAAFARAAASDPGTENQERVAQTRTRYLDQCGFEAAWQAYGAGDYARAAALFEAAISTHGAVARRQMLASKGLGGDAAGALAQFDLSDDADLALYGEILVRFWAQFSTAQRADYLAQLERERPAAIGSLAQQLYSAQHMEDAVAWAEAALAHAPSPEALLVLGQASLAAGESEEAKQWFAQAYALRPDTQAAYWYGRLLTFEPQPELGVAVLEKAVQDADGGNSLLPWLLRELAVGYARSGRCAEAEAAFARAAASDPSTENQDRVAKAAAEYGAACIPLQ